MVLLDLLNTGINKSISDATTAKKAINLIFYQSHSNDAGHPSDNYASNCSIDLSETGALKGNYIDDQSKLKDYKYGVKTIGYGGCGIIAIYNILQGLGKPTDFATLIYENENSALIRGVFGTSPESIAIYLRKAGFDVSTDYSGINENCDVSGNDAVIHFYFRSDFTAHYASGISNGDGTFCFYNSDAKNTDPMTWEEYFYKANKNTDIAYNCIFTIKREKE